MTYTTMIHCCLFNHFSERICFNSGLRRCGSVKEKQDGFNNDYIESEIIQASDPRMLERSLHVQSTKALL